MTALGNLPVLITIVVAILLGLVIIALRRPQKRAMNGTGRDNQGILLLALLILASFTWGVFLTYLLLHFGQ